MERWKPIPGWESIYEVSTFGRVRSKNRLIPRIGIRGNQKRKGRILKIQRDKYGYKKLFLSKTGTRKSIKISRLVALAFIPNPELKPIVDHQDKNRGNNHVSNLRWVTQKENMINATPRKKRKCKHCGKLT